MVVVHYFGETWNGGTRSIWKNKGLVQKMRMPREIFPVAAAVVAAYHTLPQLLVLVLFCLIAGWHLTWTAVAAGVLGFGILITFSMALGADLLGARTSSTATSRTSCRRSCSSCTSWCR